MDENKELNEENLNNQEQVNLESEETVNENVTEEATIEDL